MDAADALTRMLERAIASLYRAARALPPERLDWKPKPHMRSALDMLQEVATAPDRFWDVYETGKIDWKPEDFGAWIAERSAITDVDDLEARTRAGFGRLAAFLRSVPPARLAERVSVPFPGEFTLLDVLAYHYANASYHEGQINSIAALAEAEKA